MSISTEKSDSAPTVTWACDFNHQSLVDILFDLLSDQEGCTYTANLELKGKRFDDYGDKKYFEKHQYS